jgi:pyruvate/2-oxoglutarate dehydrogenase complex dihydrolipoamide dehydrogenase (E3) component
VATRFVIIGGGPAGNTAATYAARLGAEVTLVERDVIGGAAHLWDCIPSKTMIATGGAMSFTRRLEGMGLEQQMPEVDVDALTERIESIKMRLQRGTTNLLTSQGVQLVHGSARMLSPHDVEVTETAADGTTSTRSIVADAVLIATGTRPRIPEWCQPDGERVLTTRDCYPPKVFPEAVTIVGSGVTGVEFVHMFSSFGAKVTLVVSRQQVLPSKDPEVAAVLEDDFLRRGVQLLKGARATAIERVDRSTTARRRSWCAATTAAWCTARTRCSPSVRCPTPTASGSTRWASSSTTAATWSSTVTARATSAHLRRGRHERQAAAVVAWPACRAARSPST